MRMPLILRLMFVLLVANGVLPAQADEASASPGKMPASVMPHLATSLTEGPQRLADGSLFIPKSVQRRLGLRTLWVQQEALAVSSTLNGKVIADPAHSGRVQATQSGRVLPGPHGLPVPGRKVAKGEVLAWLEPSGAAIERGNQQAQLADLEGQLAMASGRVRRYEQLEGAVPQKEIEAARIEWAALKKRRDFVHASLHAAQPLTAPVSGVISASQVVAGQVVEARETLFEIVDPAHLSVEALAYDPARVAGLDGATALLDSGFGEQSIDLQFVGGGRQLREQALPLLFRVTSGDALLAVGQPLKVLIKHAGTRPGVRLPRQAIVRLEGGESGVWLHVEAERFVLRRVSPQALDADHVAVSEGLQAGERVVSQGGSLLSQVR